MEWKTTIFWVLILTTDFTGGVSKPRLVPVIKASFQWLSDFSCSRVHMRSQKVILVSWNSIKDDHPFLILGRQLFWKRLPLRFTSSRAEQRGLSVLAWTVRGVNNLFGGLCWTGGSAYGWAWALTRCFSFSLKSYNRGSLFRLATPLLTSSGAVPDLNVHPMVLHHFRLAARGYLGCCCTKPILR